MKFSLWPNARFSTAEHLDLARYIDDRGWYGMWFADHYMPNTTDGSTRSGDYQECWGLIPAVAATTSTIRIGPLVTPTSVHHPAVLANRAATIDQLSAGRMVLGLGAGWQINEHRAYGIALEAAGVRVTRFGEAIQVIRSLLTAERTNFDGEVYTITDAPCEPKPVQSPLPILVGTTSPRMMSFTARFADEWNTWGAPDLAISNRDRFLAACETAGIDPSTKRTSVNALLAITGDRAGVDAALGGPMGYGTVAGSVDQIVDSVGRYRDAGFDEFILPLWNQGESPAERFENLQHLESTILPHL